MPVSARTLIQSLYEEDKFTPMRISSVEEIAPIPGGGYRQPDAWVTLSWGEQDFPFFLKVKQNSTSSTIQGAIEQLKALAEVFRPANPRAMPLLMIPFISKPAMEMLEGTDVSVIDASGNFFLQTPDLLAIRLDQPKRFRDDRGIKNPYKGETSIVARVLLRRPEPSFASNSELLRVIQMRGGELAPSTVSKALVTMEQDLLIDRSKMITLLQPALLLDKLAENYERPDAAEEYKLRIPGGRAEIESLLNSTCGRQDWMWSGESSTEKYAPTTPPTRFRVYAKSIKTDRDSITQFVDKRFFNCELIVPSKNYVFFDKKGNWASEMETYLDLNLMDKRERELAEPIRENILKGLQ